MRKACLILAALLLVLLAPPASAGPQFFLQNTISSASFEGGQSVYAADVDGDGDIDVLGAALDADDINWWENDGNQSFTLHTIGDNFDGAHGVYAADLDGDSDTDVLGAAELDHDICWWENSSSGNSPPEDPINWTKRVIATSFFQARSVFASDVDGDGDADVLGAGGQGGIAWWENAGGTPPSFTQHTISGFWDAHSVYATDLDADGDVDVLGAAYLNYTSNISWWENDGGESFTEHTITGDFHRATSVYATDVDGDGDVDVLGAAALEGITWWENTGGTPPSFSEHTITGSFYGASSVYATDVDGDGDVDVLGTAEYWHYITWWENTGGTPPSFAEHSIETDLSAAASVYAADVDGDGDTDALGVGVERIAWWENTGGTPPGFAEHCIMDDFEGVHSVYATDVDGDGDVDVLGAAHSDNTIAWWENTGGAPPSFTQHTIADRTFIRATSVYATDVDSDGHVDVLGAAASDGDITWWENIGGAPPDFTEHTIKGNFSGAYSVYATDVDGDGDVDVLGAAQWDDDITWWENTGGTPPNFTEHTIKGDFDAASSVYGTDVDGDGDTDVLGAAIAYGQITWWENTGGTPPNFTEHSIKQGFHAAYSVYATDVDVDGDTDVLGAGWDAPITWWENTGGRPPSFSEHTISAPRSGPSSVYATDVDGDGDVDVLGSGGDAITWWENTGGTPPSFTEHTIQGGFLAAHPVYAIDVDGDEDTDVLGASNRIIMWENMRDFTVSSPTAPQTVLRGDSASFDIALDTPNPRGFVPVTLSPVGLPTGVGATFAPNPVTPPASSVMTAASDATTALSTYDLAVDGTADSFSHGVTVTLVVQDLSITSPAPLQAVLQGGTANFEIALTGLGGFAEPVTLTVEGLPPGAGVSFVPNPPTPPGNSLMTVTTDPATPLGTYDLEVVGTAVAGSRSTTVTLRVQIRTHLPLAMKYRAS